MGLSGVTKGRQQEKAGTTRKLLFLCLFCPFLMTTTVKARRAKRDARFASPFVTPVFPFGLLFFLGNTEPLLRVPVSPIPYVPILYFNVLSKEGKYEI